MVERYTRLIQDQLLKELGGSSPSRATTLERKTNEKIIDFSICFINISIIYYAC